MPWLVSFLRLTMSCSSRWTRGGSPVFGRSGTAPDDQVWKSRSGNFARNCPFRASGASGLAANRLKNLVRSRDASSGPILALDLGKYKSVACAYDRATAAARFQTLDTSRDELRRLFERQRPAVVVLEACTLAGWVHDLCAELGLPCKVANTASEA